MNYISFNIDGGFMEDTDWIYMMQRMQEIRLFARFNVRRKRHSEQFSSEALDLLSRIALAGEPAVKDLPHHRGGGWVDDDGFFSATFRLPTVVGSMLS